MAPHDEIDQEFEDVEESRERKRDTFERTDHEKVKADLKALAGRHHSCHPPALDIDGESDSVDEQELSHERRMQTQDTTEPRDD